MQIVKSYTFFLNPLFLIKRTLFKGLSLHLLHTCLQEASINDFNFSNDLLGHKKAIQSMVSDGKRNTLYKLDPPNIALKLCTPMSNSNYDFVYMPM